MKTSYVNYLINFVLTKIRKVPLLIKLLDTLIFIYYSHRHFSIILYYVRIIIMIISELNVHIFTFQAGGVQQSWREPAPSC